MNNDHLIAFVRGMSPILARRVKWYEDLAFNPNAPRPSKRSRLRWQWVVIAVVTALFVWTIRNERQMNHHKQEHREGGARWPRK
jgi:type IV secretory pathway TraG/TraD family ATPase VirD4